MRNVRFLAAFVGIFALLVPLAGFAFPQQAKPTAAKPLVKVVKNASLGKILIDAKGFTLYHLQKENTSSSSHSFTCTASCLTAWPPLLVPKGAKSIHGGKGVTDKLGWVARPDISKTAKQVTYDGWPLYTFKFDAKPGQTAGNGVKAFNSVWNAVSASPMVSYSITIAPDSTWGSVAVSYTYLKKSFKASCAKNSCSLSVHAGVPVKVSQTTNDPTTWPFEGWTVKAVNGGGSSRPSASSITVKSNDDYDITATYVVAG